MDIVDTSGRWSLASQSRMGTLVIVVMQPFRKAPEPLLVGAVQSRVGPLSKERGDEALGLAVGLRPIRLRDQVTNVQALEGLAEVLGERVTVGAIGQDLLDLNAPVGEKSGCREQELRDGPCALVGNTSWGRYRSGELNW
jgi:hypothetical protein